MATYLLGLRDGYASRAGAAGLSPGAFIHNFPLRGEIAELELSAG